MEIQREAIIEIVGTQYEGRAVNHNALSLQQSLIFKHQTDNPYDHNAVLLLTEDGKELGFLPKATPLYTLQSLIVADTRFLLKL